MRCSERRMDARESDKRASAIRKSAHGLAAENHGGTLKVLQEERANGAGIGASLVTGTEVVSTARHDVQYT